jgi:hypothetical protein
VPIEIVQLVLGHSSPSVTRQVYAHVMKRATAEQVEVASELVRSTAVHNRCTTKAFERSTMNLAEDKALVRELIAGGQGRGRTADLPIFRWR